MNRKELRYLFNQQYKNRMHDAVDNMVKFLRKTEEEKQKNPELPGGLDILNSLLQKGSMSMEMFLNLRQCVLNPNTPYNVRIKYRIPRKLKKMQKKARQKYSEEMYRELIKEAGV